ncbi:MAG: aldo/keto reductase [Verrucomicrobiaceae bacterium]|nr:aldo/keto reductase [Verrucomicrobiaceae bacterium]
MTAEKNSSTHAQGPLAKAGIAISPLVFGGNVFGWTVDQANSFALLDRLVDGGIHTIDTADSYSLWAPGNQGGESETIIGNWFRAHPARRAETVVITKVGMSLGPDKSGLSAKRIMEAAEASLKRLQTDVIDVYFSHFPDAETPVEETLGAYEKLIQQGKVRAIGASNHDVAQMQEALKTAAEAGLPRYEVLQPEYNLYDRTAYEGPLRDLAIAEGLDVITYYSLASGFLSGKYRSKDDLGKSPRGEGVGKYLDARGLRILEVLDAVSAAHDASPAEVALAWLMAREGVTAPIASATSIAQVDSLIRSTRLGLSAADLDQLDRASAPETEKRD